MAVSYKRLFKLMIDKDLKKKDLIRMTGISYSTIRKLENGENMNVDVLEKICRAMDCTFDEIVELLPFECGQEKCTDVSVE
nr:helix-turn-helix transcriptional regulator [Clostridia bacterium]